MDYSACGTIVADAELQFTSRAEQTMGMPAMQERLWTAEEVLDLPYVPGWQFEVIDGELFVTPAPSRTHQQTVMALLLRIGNYVLRIPTARVLPGPLDVVVDPRTLVQPDVLVIPRDARGRAEPFAGPLLLTIEVLSPSSVRRDRIKKRALYSRMEAEYWVVDSQARTIERFAPGSATAEMHRDLITWVAPGALEPLEINIPDLFAEALDP